MKRITLPVFVAIFFVACGDKTEIELLQSAEELTLVCADTAADGGSKGFSFKTGYLKRIAVFAHHQDSEMGGTPGNQKFYIMKEMHSIKQIEIFPGSLEEKILLKLLHRAKIGEPDEHCSAEKRHLKWLIKHVEDRTMLWDNW